MRTEKTRGILLTVVFTVVSIIAVIPFYFMFIMSSYATDELYKGIVILPGTHLFINIKTVLESGFSIYYFNSIYTTVITTVVSVFISFLAGLALAKYDFKMKKPMYYFILMTMMIPGQLGLIAYVIQMRVLGLNNTHIPLILVWLANPFSVFWMRQYIKSNVPKEVLESARIDGCNEFNAAIRIVLPYIKPALFTVAIIVMMWSWNNYLLPLVTLHSPKKFTIPLGVASLGSQYRADYAARITGLSLGTLPMIILFIFGGKYFVSGLAAGAVKG